MEEEPGMSGPKQRRKVTVDEEEAFPRHTPGLNQGRELPSEAERRLAEAKMPKKWRSRVRRGLTEA